MLRLFNSMGRTLDAVTPRDADHVRMYVCGPTVYSYAHIGNARPAVVFDVLARRLRAQFSRVTYARNITDVDDKIIAAAAADGVGCEAVAARFTTAYHTDLAALNVAPPDIEPRATGHIPQMIAMIEELIALDRAYAAEGHVLFHIPSCPTYGRLSGANPDDMLAGARVEVAPWKRDPRDFVLWKPSHAAEPGWDSPWGVGRPGWHIECSAMIRAHLGEGIDIHGGGIDLRFPHHENEIAQGTDAGSGFITGMSRCPAPRCRSRSATFSWCAIFCPTCRVRRSATRFCPPITVNRLTGRPRHRARPAPRSTGSMARCATSRMRGRGPRIWRRFSRRWTMT